MLVSQSAAAMGAQEFLEGFASVIPAVWITATAAQISISSATQK